MKRKSLIIALIAMAGVLTPMSVKASDTDVSANDVKKLINNQITSSENITAKAYVGRVSKCNYISTVAVNTKSNTTYIDYYATSGYRAYLKGKKAYVYDSESGKWNILSSDGKKMKANIDIDTNNIKLLQDKEFRGNKCYALKVSHSKTNSIYYVNKSNDKLVGITTQNGSRKVTTLIDTKTKVTVPAAVLKGKKTNDGTKTSEAVKVRTVKYNGTDVSDVKISSYSELKKLISSLEKKKDGNTAQRKYIVDKLKTYDSKYFKKSALYLKKYSYNYPASLYAVQKNTTNGKLNVVLTEYYQKGMGYHATGQRYLVFVEAGKNAAKSISNVKISLDKTEYIVPSVK